MDSAHGGHSGAAAHTQVLISVDWMKKHTNTQLSLVFTDKHQMCVCPRSPCLPVTAASLALMSVCVACRFVVSQLPAG